MHKAPNHKPNSGNRKAGIRLTLIKLLLVLKAFSNSLTADPLRSEYL